MHLPPRSLSAVPLLALLVLGCGRGNDTSGPAPRAGGSAKSAEGQVVLRVPGMH